MDCPKCGYAMTDFDVECPRCKRLGEQAARQQPAAQQQVAQPPPQELADYVSQARARGVPDDAIRQQLVNAGWAPATVDGYMGRPSYSQKTAPPPPASDATVAGASTQPGSAGATQSADRRTAIDTQLPPNYGLGVAAFFACVAAAIVTAIIGGVFGPWGLVIGTVVWMGIDSSRLARHGVPGFSPVAAVLGGLLLWVVVLPWYLVARDKMARALEGIGVRVEGINGLFIYAAVGVGIALVVNLASLQLAHVPTTRGAVDDTSRRADTASAPAPASPRPPQKTWVEVARWSGQGMQTTPKFTVGDEWAIEWATQPGEYGPMNFAIFTYSGTGAMVGLEANIIGAGSSVSHKHQPGTYYLEVNSGQPWQIKIWEKR